MREKVFYLVKSLAKVSLSLIAVPLWFIKIFKGVGYLPNQNGDVLKVVYRHSMFENMRDGFSPFLAYASIFLLVFSAVFNIVAIKFPQIKKINFIANSIFFASIFFFFILLICAKSVARGY